jgi:hypothetical protein
MSFLGDLFSCGRARRTRETTTEPLETDDATPEPSNVHGTTATTIHPTEKPNGVPAPNEDRIERVANQARADEHSDIEKRGSRVIKDDDIEMAVIPEKSKSNAGWMVEQRVLVTATSATKQDVSFAPEQEPEPQLEQKQEHVHAPIPPVRCATPEQEPWNSTPVAPTQVQPEVCDTVLTASVRCATPEPETRAATPEQQSEQSTPPVQEVTPEVALVGSTSPSLELDDVVEDVPPPKKAAPVCLLDLPPGKLVFSCRVRPCANAIQRSGTASMSV